MLRWFQDLSDRGVFTTDETLVIRSWNGWLEAQTGWPEDSVIGKQVSEVIPGFAERGLERYYRAALGGEVRLLSERFHNDLRKMRRVTRKTMGNAIHLAPLIAEWRGTRTPTLVFGGRRGQLMTLDLYDNDLGNLQMRYTTRQQPVPTSRLLENALASATANDMFSLGWSRAIGTGTNFSFSASYASSPYYLLMPTYFTREDGTASRFEFEALWSTRF